MNKKDVLKIFATFARSDKALFHGAERRIGQSKRFFLLDTSK
ncbi:hypothetical protein HMPREF1990_01788 [Porphyromonas gingivalis W4087]|nr:hypothetical protein A343_1442 [Porphyromonas gingivalis JCVI SC001]ERJ87422.1 hypothetical protein HMPREF1990_01788 [Porphyromonas gingivalis W4087]